MNDVQKALDKLRRLDETARAANLHVRDLAERQRDGRDHLRQLRRRLDYLEHHSNSDPAEVQTSRQRIKREETEVARIAEQHEVAAAAWRDQQALADRCREYLTSGGASIEELESGVALPPTATPKEGVTNA